MKRLFAFLAWSLCFFVLLLATDQLFVHVRFPTSGLRTVQNCYLDFRQRLLHLGPRHPGPTPAVVPAPTAPPISIESAIGQSKEPAAAKSRDAADAPRYVYVDGHGQLQFAATLKDIPAAFRKGAQRLAH
ncbi:MAG TPA: hypothetical protein VJ955_06400 [Desulfuromonadales bacterium]|nr:hypothetical protein [Desulfuromonadales bacterium]